MLASYEGIFYAHWPRGEDIQPYQVSGCSQRWRNGSTTRTQTDSGDNEDDDDFGFDNGGDFDTGVRFNYKLMDQPEGYTGRDVMIGCQAVDDERAAWWGS